MKRLLTLAILAYLAFSSLAMAATVTTATVGDQNSSGVYRLTGSANYDSGNTGWLAFAQDTGIYYPYTTGTTNTTMTAAQTGTTYVFTGTSNNTRFTLPTATVGMSFTFVNSTTKSMQFTPQSTDTIQFATNTAGQGLISSSSAVGDQIEFFCFVANTWAIKSHSGTFTHTGALP